MKKFNPLNRILKKDISKHTLEDRDFIKIHHVFCKTYGFITLKDFKDIPLPMFWNLLNEIANENKEQMKQIKRLKKKGKK